MIYLVDAYNLLFLNNSIKEGESFSRYREKAIALFCANFASFNSEIILVFDAYRQEGLSSRFSVKSIEVVYSAQNQKADDYILEFIRFSKSPRSVTVVTNDRALSRESLALGAKVMGTSNFLKLAKGKSKKKEEKSEQYGFTNSDMEFYEQSFTRCSKKKKSK